MRDHSIDSALDYCCMKRLNQEAEPERFIEVCLRCGNQAEGDLEENIEARCTHLCDPANRKQIPEWALVGRKRDRSVS